MVSTEQNTYVALGWLQRQHDHFLATTYRRRLRNEDLDDIARDPETTYHLEAVEAIGTYLEAN